MIYIDEVFAEGRNQIVINFMSTKLSKDEIRPLYGPPKTISIQTHK